MGSFLFMTLFHNAALLELYSKEELVRYLNLKHFQKDHKGERQLVFLPESFWKGVMLIVDN